MNCQIGIRGTTSYLILVVVDLLRTVRLTWFLLSPSIRYIINLKLRGIYHRPAMASGGVPVDIEEDDELFEIDLEAVNNIVPPSHFSDHTYGFFTAAGGATLLANCLLPIIDVSNAIPMIDSNECEIYPFEMLPELTRIEKVFQLSLDFGLRRALVDCLEMEMTS